ncbi:hypothetical protein BDV93DRAFT_455244 [Ceratobasidium sp. AG-I]|nr:hypothetical protein BDV93DRAFT_455244 [Ceratobasidium sp. AG-I]
MQDIKTVLRDFNLVHGRNPDVGEFLEEGKRYGLNGVHKPFWRRLPNFDICKALSPDMLHGVHKMTFDHPHKWNSNGLGPEELDARLMAQIPVPGERMFPQGVSKLQQLSGKDHRALERVHVPIVAHAPTVAEGGGGSDKLTKATRGIMDCVFLAQYPVHTEQTIAAFEESYRVFHANKDDNVIRHWAIPKIHILRHIPEHVRLKGTMDNYNTETMEHLHRPMLKDPYRGTNRRGWKDQIVRRLKLSEAMCNYADFMDWNNAQTDKGKSGSHTNESKHLCPSKQCMRL